MSGLTPETFHTTTVKVNDLLTQSVADWAAHLDDCARYAEEKRPEINTARSQEFEFAACATALTQLVSPYDFPKKPCDDFVDKGYGALHGSEFWKHRAHGYYTLIGTADYWAAAIVDPDFMELCRQRIRLRDDIYGQDAGKPGSASFNLSAFESTVRIPEVHHTFWDYPRGAWHFIDTTVDHGDATIPEMGTLYRLSGQLRKSFRAIMSDPEKSAAVTRVRDYLYQAYEAKVDKQKDQNEVTSQIRKNDPAKNADAEMKMRKLAYVTMLGYDELEVKNGDVERAIDTAVRSATYKNGQLAPHFDTDSDRSPLGKMLDDILYNKMGVRRPVGPMQEGPAPDKGIMDYASTTFWPDDTAIPDQPKAFVQKFLAEARAKAATPQPAA